jgi:hypothetical protein
VTASQGAEAHDHGDRAKNQNADGKVPLQCHFDGKPPLLPVGLFQGLPDAM